jgi:hypothetical protein
MTSRVWYRALLSSEQIAAGHVDLISSRFAEAMKNAAAPEGACLFATSHGTREGRLREDLDDQGDLDADAVYFSPASIAAVPDLIVEYQAEPSEPPDRARASLLVGTPADWDLLSRLSH